MRGDAFSAAEKETTRGDASCPGAGLRLIVLAGEARGMLEAWLRKAEKEGTLM